MGVLFLVCSSTNLLFFQTVKGLYDLADELLPSKRKFRHWKLPAVPAHNIIMFGYTFSIFHVHWLTGAKLWFLRSNTGITKLSPINGMTLLLTFDPSRIYLIRISHPYTLGFRLHISSREMEACEDWFVDQDLMISMWVVSKIHFVCLSISLRNNFNMWHKASSFYNCFRIHYNFQILVFTFWWIIHSSLWMQICSIWLDDWVESVSKSVVSMQKNI